MVDNIGFHVGNFICGLLNMTSHINTFSTALTGRKFELLSEEEALAAKKANNYSISGNLAINWGKPIEPSIWDYSKILHTMYTKLLDVHNRIEKKVDQKEIMKVLSREFLKAVPESGNQSDKFMNYVCLLKSFKKCLSRILYGKENMTEDEKFTPSCFKKFMERYNLTRDELLRPNFKSRTYNNLRYWDYLREDVFHNIHNILQEIEVHLQKVRKSTQIIKKDIVELWINPNKTFIVPADYCYIELLDIIIFMSISVELRFEAEIYYFKKKDRISGTVYDNSTWKKYLYKKSIDLDYTAGIRKSGFSNEKAIVVYNNTIENIQTYRQAAFDEKAKVNDCINVINALITKNSNIDETIIGNLPDLSESFIPAARNMGNNNKIVFQMETNGISTKKPIFIKSWNANNGVMDFMDKMRNSIDEFNKPFPNLEDDNRLKLKLHFIGPVENPDDVNNEPIRERSPILTAIFVFVYNILGVRDTFSYNGTDKIICLESDQGRFSILGQESTVSYCGISRCEETSQPNGDRGQEKLIGEIGKECMGLGPIDHHSMIKKSEDAKFDFINVLQPTIIQQILTILGVKNLFEDDIRGINNIKTLNTENISEPPTGAHIPGMQVPGQTTPAN